MGKLQKAVMDSCLLKWEERCTNKIFSLINPSFKIRGFLC